VRSACLQFELENLAMVMIRVRAAGRGTCDAKGNEISIEIAVLRGESRNFTSGPAVETRMTNQFHAKKAGQPARLCGV